MTKRKLGVALSAVLLLLGVGMAVQPAAAKTAAHGNRICEVGEVCLFNNGDMFYDGYWVNPGNCSAQTPKAIDHMWNRTTIDQRPWSGTNCTGRKQLVPANTGAGVNLFWSWGGR